MEVICRYVDAKTILLIFSFCFIVRNLIRMNNWRQNRMKTQQNKMKSEQYREVKEDNQRRKPWDLNWLRKNPLPSQDTSEEKEETKNFIQKRFRENSTFEIIAKLVLIGAMLLPWLVAQIYLLFEKSVIKSPIIAFNLIKFSLKSVFFPLVEKIVFPMVKILYYSIKIVLQNILHLNVKVTNFLKTKLKNLLSIGLDILSYLILDICVPTIRFVRRVLLVTFSNLKTFTNTCTKALSPLLSKIDQVVSFLFSAGKLLTLTFYRKILLPLSDIITTSLDSFLKHSLNAAMKTFDWLFCLVLKFKKLVFHIYFDLCIPVCKFMLNNVYQPTIEAMYLITNTLIKIVNIIIIPAISPIVVFLQSVLYQCWHHCHACYALMTGLFSKCYANIYNVISVVTDWYLRVVSPVILEMCYVMCNMMCLIYNLVWTLETVGHTAVSQAVNFIADMYEKVYNSAILPVYDLFAN